VYDARGKTDFEVKLQKVILGILAVAFLIGGLAWAIFWPTAGERRQDKIDNYQVYLAGADDNIIPVAMPDLEMQVFESSLLELDAAAHAQLTRNLKNSTNQANAIDTTLTEIEAVLRAHAPLLASADVRSFDALLTLSRNGLRKAAHAQSQYCLGTHYDGLGTGTKLQRSAFSLTKEFAVQIPAAGQYVIDASTVMLQAATTAQGTPALNGPLTTVDRAAIEGVRQSILADPDMKEIFAAFQSEDDFSPDVAKIDMCTAAASAITAIATLPQDTKARIWAALVTGVDAQPVAVPFAANP